ncbi:hypothetical protein Plhal304r1_c055g0141311 [Plasmopara halstedii]
MMMEADDHLFALASEKHAIFDLSSVSFELAVQHAVQGSGMIIAGPDHGLAIFVHCRTTFAKVSAPEGKVGENPALSG